MQCAGKKAPFSVFLASCDVIICLSLRWHTVIQFRFEPFSWEVARFDCAAGRLEWWHFLCCCCFVLLQCRTFLKFKRYIVLFISVFFCYFVPFALSPHADTTRMRSHDIYELWYPYSLTHTERVKEREREWKRSERLARSHLYNRKYRLMSVVFISWHGLWKKMCTRYADHKITMICIQTRMRYDKWKSLAKLLSELGARNSQFGDRCSVS